MTDPRITKLAELLINHSTRLKKSEHVLIEAFDIPEEMVIALVKAALKAGGHPHVAQRSNRVIRALDFDAADENLSVWADYDTYRMAKMQAYIGVRGSENVSTPSPSILNAASTTPSGACCAGRRPAWPNWRR